jgi:hypothetical protein
MSATPSNTFSVYKNKPFARFARRARIADADLWKAALSANEGVVDADLGGGVFKQRIARAGEGKSGGSRTLLLLRRGDRAVYVFGFEKKDMANISAKELLVYRELADIYLRCPVAEMKRRVEEGVMIEVRAPRGDENA